MNYNLIAIIGEAGSGKDTILRKLVECNPALNEIVSYTTRPPREGEKDGVNYHFVTGEEFGELVLQNQMLEASCFNDWFYGTGYDSLREDKINIGVFNPSGVEALMLNEKITMDVFYINASEKNRLIRQLNREENPDIDEIFRRLKTDREDFDEIFFDYYSMRNETPEDLDEIVGIFNKIIDNASV